MCHVNYYFLNVHTAIHLSGFVDCRLLNADCRMILLSASVPIILFVFHV